MEFNYSPTDGHSSGFLVHVFIYSTPASIEQGLKSDNIASKNICILILNGYCQFAFQKGIAIYTFTNMRK